MSLGGLLGRIVSHLFTLFGIGLLIAAGVMDNWYTITFNSNIVSKMSLMQSCTTVTVGSFSSTTCNPVTNTSDTTGCTSGAATRSGSDFSTRVIVSQAVLFCAAGIGLGAFSLSIVSSVMSAGPLRWVSAGLIFFAGLVGMIAPILYSMTVEQWFFCDQTFCNRVNSALPVPLPCTNLFGEAFLAGIGGCICFGIGAVAFMSFALCCGDDEEPNDSDDKKTNEHTAQDRDIQPNEPTHGEEAVSTAHEQEYGADQYQAASVEGPAGYVDYGNGYWWSDSDQMYWHAESGAYCNLEGAWFTWDDAAGTWAPWTTSV